MGGRRPGLDFPKCHLGGEVAADGWDWPRVLWRTRLTVESCNVGEAEFELIDSTNWLPVKVCPFLSLALEGRQGTVFESGYIVKRHFD
jgi:hypothetical protein